MKTGGRVLFALILFVPALFVLLGAMPAAQHETHRLYVAVPGIRNELQYGGVGILVFDMDAGYKLIKRIPTGRSARPARRERKRHRQREYRQTLRQHYQARFVLISSPKRKFGRRPTMAEPIDSPSPRTANYSTCLPSRAPTG